MIFLADEKGRQDVELGMLQLQGVIKWPRGGTLLLKQLLRASLLKITNISRDMNNEHDCYYLKQWPV